MRNKLATGILIATLTAAHAQVVPPIAMASYFDTVGGMQQVTPLAPGDVVVAGYNIADDGGGGIFHYDPASVSTADSCTIFAPVTGPGRWKRIYSGAVNVDWCGANASGDQTAAFTAAAAFPSVTVPNRSYVLNGPISISSGQSWSFDRTVFTHTVNSKTFFQAVAVDNWSLRGSVTFTGTCSGTCGSTGEQGLYVEAARRCRISGVSATLFNGNAIHIAAGTRGASSFLGDVCQWRDIHVDQSTVGLLIDAGTAAEYQEFSDLTATGNLTGVQIAAGNIKITGGNIVSNSTGLLLTGGSNNGHGIITDVSINHNAAYNIVADGVSLGYTLNGIHAYANTATSGYIWFKNATTGVAIMNSVIDSPVIHDATGTDRILNSWTGGGTFFAVTGSNSSGLIQAGDF